MKKLAGRALACAFVGVFVGVFVGHVHTHRHTKHITKSLTPTPWRCGAYHLASNSLFSAELDKKQKESK